MMKRATLTSEAGAAIGDNQNSQTAGDAGPTLLQDHDLIEKLARFNRERIPERVVHAVGTGAHGKLEVTNDELPRWTCMKLFARAGQSAPVFVRFSRVAGSKGAPDTARDPRGFAIKVYTEEGNWDVAGNNTPIFFIRDGIKFPDFIHSQKEDPHTNRQEPDNIWDFFSHTPEATHQFTILFGDRGIPASYRYMDGFGSHTFQWVNANGDRSWVKFHFKSDQGVRYLSNQEAAVLGGKDPAYLHHEFYSAIARADYPSWTMSVQVMPDAAAARYRFNPFDVTKVWPHGDYPLIPIAKLRLDRVPDNYFAESEQVSFEPSNFVPGIGPSPDRLLQARLFAYGDAARYRLGVNHTKLSVNIPRGVEGGARNYGRDGAMRADDNGGASKNYQPNSNDGPMQTGLSSGLGYPLSGAAGITPQQHHAEDDDFTQVGALYRLMKDNERTRLVENIAESLAQVSREDVISRATENFRKADPDYGQRVAEAVSRRRDAMVRPQGEY